MSVCTAAQLKSRLDITVAGADAALAEVIAGVVADFEAWCRRRLVRPAAAVTEYWDGGHADSATIFLNYFPAVVITSVKESLYHGHAAAGVTALTANDDYILNDARGRLVRVGAWLSGPDAVQVVYTGGYAAAGVTPLPAGQIAMPDKIIEAAIRQASFVWQRRKSLGLTSESMGPASMTAYARDELLPTVRELLAEYRRVLIG